MKKIKEVKWLFYVMGLFLLGFLILSLLTYVVDPFFQYRVKENGYMLNGEYSSPGLIKNYEYNTIIIGSSMIQNFDMDLFANELDCVPLKVGVGGMTDEDMLEYVSLANSVKKAESYYLCIDISQFANSEESKTIDYLMKDDFFSKIKYVLSYESLFRYMPIDIAFLCLEKIGYELPQQSWQYRTDIDKMGYWAHQYEFGETVVFQQYLNNEYGVSAIDTNDLYNRMVTSIDAFFEELDVGDAKCILFFPPYSSLFWCDTQEKGYFEVYLDAKDYFTRCALENGYIVYDFQSADYTMDISNYKDLTHYSAEINDRMIYCFASKECMINEENCSEMRSLLISNTEIFRDSHLELFQ